MAIGAFTFAASSSQTASTSVLKFTVGAAITPSFVTRDHGAIDTLWYPAKRAIVYANGMDFQYHVIDGVAYLNGPRAPQNAPTLVSTSVRATATITFASSANNPANNDAFKLTGKSGTTQTAAGIVFKTTLTTVPVGFTFEIKRGSTGVGATDLATTIANMAATFAGTGTNGTHYFFYSPLGYSLAQYLTALGITISSTTSTVVTFRAVDYSIDGNSYVLSEVTDPGNNFVVATFSGGSTGTGYAPTSGTYQGAYAFLRSADDAQTGISAAATITQDGNYNLTFSAYDTPATRDGIDYFRIFRTTSGGSQFFRIGEDAASPFTDTVDDTAINDTDFDEYDDSIYRPYTSGYPDRYLCHALYKGCIFGTGAEIAAQYSAGTASVTVSSATVTLSAAATPKVDWIGRHFAVAADAITDYRILEVVEATRVLTLNKVYEGATNATASYTVTDARDPFELVYSEPLFLNNWPPERSVKGITGKDPVGCVALRAMWRSLLVWTRTALWRVDGTPESGFDFNEDHDGCGAFNQSSVVATDGLVFWLGPNGAFRMASGSDPEPISKPPYSQGRARGIAGTLARINKEAVRGIVGNYNPTENLIRWFVPLDGSPYNSHAVVYDLQSGAFTLDECVPVTCAKTIKGSDGVDYTVAGDAFGTPWQLDVGYSEGGFGFSPVQTISTYTAATRTIVLTGSPALPTTSGGLRGCPLYHKAANGTIQRAIIASNTASNIVLVAAFSTAPLAGDQVNLCDIRLRALSAKSDFGTPESKKMLWSVVVAARPTTGGQMWVAGSVDDNDPRVNYLRSTSQADRYDLTSTKGKYQFFVRRGPGARVQVEINAFGVGADISVSNVTVVTRERSPDRETVQ